MPSETRRRNGRLTRLGNNRGQGMIELGIIMLVFVLLVAGVMQFGHAFLVTNVITHAARDGARLAASWQNRGGCGQINNAAAIQNVVLNGIGAVTDSAAFTVTVGQIPAVSALTPPCAAAGATPTVTVNVHGCVSYIFDILRLSSGGCSGGFLVNRTVTFDDELRATFG